MTRILTAPQMPHSPAIQSDRMRRDKDGLLIQPGAATVCGESLRQQYACNVAGYYAGSAVNRASFSLTTYESIPYGGATERRVHGRQR
jgi:hypothetical protein